MNRFGLPDLGLGIGLRSSHFGEILSRRPELDWFEVLSENYLDTGGRPLWVLDQVCERYPVALHGVSLSIGEQRPARPRLPAQAQGSGGRTRRPLGLAITCAGPACWAATLTTCCRCPTTSRPCATSSRACGRCRTSSSGRWWSRTRRPTWPSRPRRWARPSSWRGWPRRPTAACCSTSTTSTSAPSTTASTRAPTSTLPADRVVQYHLAGHTHKGTHILDTHSGPVHRRGLGALRPGLRAHGPRGHALRVGRGHAVLRRGARAGAPGRGLPPPGPAGRGEPRCLSWPCRSCSAGCRPRSSTTGRSGKPWRPRRPRQCWSQAGSSRPSCPRAP